MCAHTCVHMWHGCLYGKASVETEVFFFHSIIMLSFLDEELSFCLLFTRQRKKDRKIDSFYLLVYSPNAQSFQNQVWLQLEANFMSHHSCLLGSIRAGILDEEPEVGIKPRHFHVGHRCFDHQTEKPTSSSVCSKDKCHSQFVWLFSRTGTVSKQTHCKVHHLCVKYCDSKFLKTVNLRGSIYIEAIIRIIKSFYLKTYRLGFTWDFYTQNIRDYMHFFFTV